MKEQERRYPEFYASLAKRHRNSRLEVVDAAFAQQFQQHHADTIALNERAGKTISLNFT
ncbi:hypothetical protein [Alcanivorax sp.]|uniref:hypothetical protein n=1 Tax=Alcanivorax sp. TaxID=1872427 RepID=UPI0025C4837E|nr:hypothetical protein [Alcanivorax sp.]